MIDTSLLPAALVVLVVATAAAVLSLGVIAGLGIEYVQGRRRGASVRQLPVADHAADAHAA